MYIPKSFEETRREVLWDFMAAHPLGMWVIQGEGELVANAIPFLLDRDRGELGTLVGHVARANPVWKMPPRATPSMVLFQGAQAYISPSWYAAKREHGKVVPTWNYIVVEAQGTPQFIEDRAQLRDVVTRLTETHEAERAAPWRVTDAPEEFIDELLGAIVGVEIPISRLVGKWKVSQNRSAADREGVAAALESQGNAEMAQAVRSR